jgi:hypothetical protein
MMKVFDLNLTKGESVDCKKPNSGENSQKGLVKNPKLFTSFFGEKFVVDLIIFHAMLDDKWYLSTT